MSHSSIAASELILNKDGSIYHLNIRPEDLAPIVITVGDPDRVTKVSKHFDTLELRKGKREFITHTGFIGQKRISVISTGIGTDNIDIVINELDALVNIDFETRSIKQEKTSLSLIRIGTSGTFQPDIEIGSTLISTYGVGLDALMHYYDAPTVPEEHQKIEAAIGDYFKNIKGITPYLAIGSTHLASQLTPNLPQGITITAPGFYAPQGRLLRAKSTLAGQIVKQFQNFKFENHRFTNLEMETAGIYALANVLGHEALSINAILANRATGRFHHQPDVVIEKCIEHILSQCEKL